MPTETTTDAVLNGIITCNQCNAGMALKQDETTGRLYFTCSQMDGRVSMAEECWATGAE